MVEKLFEGRIKSVCDRIGTIVCCESIDGALELLSELVVEATEKASWARKTITGAA